MGRSTYKYALTVVDIASRFKEAQPLTSKNSDEVAKAFKTIYTRGPLKWPQMLQVDPGREFMGAVTKEMENHKTSIRRGHPEIHRDQAIVERFNRTLAERLFGHQYAVEMRSPEGLRSTEWVKRLPSVVSALNNQVTRLIGMKPAAAIKKKNVYAEPSTKYLRPVGLNEKSSHPGLCFGICTNLVSLKAGRKEPPIQSGPWMSLTLNDLLPNRINLFSTICATDLSVVLYVKNCLWYLRIQNYLQLWGKPPPAGMGCIVSGSALLAC